MTRARALKQVIRDRAAKTGERYTTARRQVLKLLQPRSVAPAASDSARDQSGELRRDLAIAASGREGGPASSKGSVSDAKSREKTGHGLDHWFDVLDRFGAVEKGRTAAARHLYDDHQVPGWYSQGITVAYERERGVRVLNQRCDGEYEVSVSKVMTAPTAAVIKAITDVRQRRRWTGGVDPALVNALTAGVADKKSKGFVVRPDGQARFRYQWDGTTVQFYLLPKPGGKTSLAVQHTGLAAADAVEVRRAQWKAAFGAVAKLLSE